MVYFQTVSYTHLDVYKRQILNSHVYSIPIVRYINKKFPSIRIIVWYSNPVSKDTPIRFYKELDCEIWSFDKDDCQKYHLRSNNQFIDHEMFNNLSNEIKYDLSFVGLDKGRLRQLLDLKCKFNEKNISTYLYIVNSNKNSSDSYDYEDRISYKELLNIEANSRALLDIVQPEQKGQTLRPIEALFFKKKIVTNNYSILETDFYNYKNIFVLGRDNIESIEEFLKSDYEDISSDVLEKYTVKGWISNFFL
ncbi:hypothetical protein A5868_002130 [Enterococcus sp. 12F9_DIV0723]|nr:hypothetical protein A5868_002130 [Enterococcus sp. 12F9_DIV0723]